MRQVAPPRRTVALQAAISLALGVQWVWGSAYRSTQFPFKHLDDIGAHLSASRPMLLWGLLFLTVATVISAGIERRSNVVAGVGCLLAVPVLSFYGVLNGWAAGQYVAPVPPGSRHFVHVGAFTVLILTLGIATWYALNAVMLLGRRDNPWKA